MCSVGLIAGLHSVAPLLYRRRIFIVPMAVGHIPAIIAVGARIVML